MSGRKSNEARAYLRRSDGKQETSLGIQLEWAIADAKKHGVMLEAAPSDLDVMLSQRLHHYRGIYLDNAITGADLERPGFQSLVSDVLANRRVSHMFTYKRDRLGRPDDPLEMMVIEQQLTKAGITLVFSDGIALPTRRGQTDVAHIVEMLFGYHRSGEFLRDLAERVLLTHQTLARQGFRTGGNPPYGFGRFLVGPDGQVIEELPTGRYVRQQGYHVRDLPNDRDKITIWVYILDLKHAGWGFKRIAQHLNDLAVC